MYRYVIFFIPKSTWYKAPGCGSTDDITEAYLYTKKHARQILADVACPEQILLVRVKDLAPTLRNGAGTLSNRPKENFRGEGENPCGEIGL